MYFTEIWTYSLHMLQNMSVSSHWPSAVDHLH